ncbi:hypothetical protein [Catenovulum sediminis]|uniref:Uncharacterized protein n=1 Tax=Catenovulum sediminis TaxID=1740262 RepID=A0ABV1RCU0_9ALTE
MVKVFRAVLIAVLEKLLMAAITVDVLLPLALKLLRKAASLSTTKLDDTWVDGIENQLIKNGDLPPQENKDTSNG